MADEKSIEHAFDVFMKNDYWKEFYDGPKSDAQRRKNQIGFLYEFNRRHIGAS